MRIDLNRLARLLPLALLTLILVSACSKATDVKTASYKQSVEDCRMVQHMMGSTCVARNPQRVVGLFLEAYANSLALGVQPIAVLEFPNSPLPKYLQGKGERVESAEVTYPPNLEKILLLKPDLILSGPDLGDVYKPLSYIAPTVVLNSSFPFVSWKEQLEELAQVLGKEEVYQELTNQYEQRIERFRQALGDRRKTITVSTVNRAC